MEYNEVITVGNNVTAQYDTSLGEGLGWSRCVQTMRYKINEMHLHKISIATVTLAHLHHITTGRHITKYFTRAAKFRELSRKVSCRKL